MILPKPAGGYDYQIMIALPAAGRFITIKNNNKQMENEEEKHEIVKDEGLAPEKKALAGYAKYTGVAFQMMAIIGASAFIGYKADQYYDHEIQWVTALTCVLGVCLSIYQTVRQLKS